VADPEAEEELVLESASLPEATLEESSAEVFEPELTAESGPEAIETSEEPSEE
jgi:hypothetical protein